MYLKKLFKKKHRAKLRKAMRGFRVLKENNRLDNISKIKREIALRKLDYEKKIYPSKLIFGAGITQAEIIIRQYLVVHFSDYKLNKKILASIGSNDTKLSHPMPLLWHDVFTRHGVSINKIYCQILWFCYIIIFFGYGVLGITRVNMQLLRNFGKKSEMSSAYAYFPGLTATNLCQDLSESNNYDLISWYKQWHGKADVNTVYHSVHGVPDYHNGELKVSYLASPIVYQLTLSGHIKYVCWSFAALIQVLLDVIRGRWYNVLLLNEASKAALVRLQDAEMLAKEYMFGTTGVIYRPLWTYEAENKRSRINIYFYSLNSGGWKTAKGYPLTAPGWTPMSWQYYLVWDKYQADFVSREVGDSANVKIVGPIWFSDTVKTIQRTDSISVSVFDVQPHRDSRYQVIGIPENYYVPDICNQFLLDIYSLCKKFNFTVYFKRKRDIGRMLHPRYKTLIKDLDRKENFYSIDPDISAIKLIKISDLVISMPFSSPAVLGRSMSKPSIFYDSSGMLCKEDRSAHGIELLSNKNELELWLRSSTKTISHASV